MKRIISSLAVIGLLLSCVACSKPEENQEVELKAIQFNRAEITLEKGVKETLTVLVTPENATPKDFTWSSSNPSVAKVKDGIVEAVGVGSAEITVKCGELVDRCKIIVVISAESVGLNLNNLELGIGESVTLKATVEPADYTGELVWSSNDPTVATVENGKVTGIAEGNTLITASVGTMAAACEVVVIQKIPAGAVDLGLSVYWASCNIGASKPEEYGDYYTWGDVETHYSSKDPLTWKEDKEGYYYSTYKWFSSTPKIIKYCTDSWAEEWGGSGAPDNKTVLETGPDGDDVASKTLGGKWRMPTKEEWEELLTKCTVTWTTKNGVNGALITASNGNSIFLPAAGQGNEEYLGYLYGDYCYYWSSSLDINYQTCAWEAYFADGLYGLGEGSHRLYGDSVRPVSK